MRPCGFGQDAVNRRHVLPRGVVLVVAYTVVVVGLRRREYAQAEGHSSAAFTGAAAVAALLCVAGVVAGLYATFHK